MANKKKMINRTIRFATINLTENGHPLDVFDLFNRINTLDFKTGERYCRSTDGENLVVMIDNISNVIKGAIGDSRKEDLPIFETAGKLSPITIPSGSGLLDCNHFVIFKNHYDVPIIAYEVNRYAISMRRLSQYVMTKFSGTMCSFELIKRTENAGTIIKSIEHLRSVAIRAHSACDFTNFDLTINKAFSALRETTDAGYITMKLDCEYAKTALRVNWLNNIDRFIQDQNAWNLLESFIIRHKNTKTGETEELNLVDLFLNEKVKVEPWDNEHNAVKPQSMFRNIEESMQKHKSLLEGIQ